MLLLLPLAQAASPGVHELVVPLAGVQVELTAVLPVPDPTDPTPPLIVALHYAGQAGVKHYATPYVTDLVAPGLAELGAVIVAPDCPSSGWTDATSERVVLALVDYAARAWGADRKRVIVTGYSMGGVGTWFFAAKHPEVFAAAVPVASAPGDWLAQVPVFAVQGLRDELFPAARVETAVQALTARGIPASYRAVDRSHYEVTGYVGALAAAVPWLRAQLAD